MQLHQWLQTALGGTRQLVFVTGEPGIGKTTVIEAFLARTVEHGVWVARGQCVEHYGAGEAYLPVLEGISRLCRQPGGESLIAILRRHAPLWLLQLSSLISAADREELQRELVGATPGRMLREMAEAVDVLTAQIPLVLVLEDLQWSDASTLDLITFLAKRRESARLLLIGTYRPAEALVSEHPLRVVRQELLAHRHCAEFPLSLLTEAAVVEYVARRFNVGAVREPPLQDLARVIHLRTEGNPLFVVNVVDFLVARGVIVSDGEQWAMRGELTEIGTGVPETIVQIVEKQGDRLKAQDQGLLKAASVAGSDFSAGVIAAALGEDVVATEERCERLAQQHCFLQAAGVGEWPDGTVAARYRFIHALYQSVWYEQVTAAQRVRLHQRIGECIEHAYGERASYMAAELARHFEQSRDVRRAVHYLAQAAENSIGRYAYREAIGHVTKGLAFLTTLPEAPERLRQELVLQTLLGVSQAPTQGYTSPEVGEAYSRARELSQQLGQLPHLFTVLAGLWQFSTARAGHETAYELGTQMLTVAEQRQDPVLDCTP